MLRHRVTVGGETAVRVLYSARSLDEVRFCGPTAFVEMIAGQLVDIGHDPSRVRTERFGPTGS
jgi:ferredoxin-NADP reductase